MPYKKKAIPGTVQFNKLAADLPIEKYMHKFSSDMAF